MFQKQVEWDPDKNIKLQKERGISFERIFVAIESGHLLAIIPNNNQKYAHQKIMVVDVDAYIVLVPFVEDERHIFLKTAFPSRKATKTYLLEDQKNEKL